MPLCIHNLFPELGLSVYFLSPWASLFLSFLPPPFLCSFCSAFTEAAPQHISLWCTHACEGICCGCLPRCRQMSVCILYKRRLAIFWNYTVALIFVLCPIPKRISLLHLSGYWKPFLPPQQAPCSCQTQWNKVHALSPYVPRNWCWRAGPMPFFFFFFSFSFMNFIFISLIFFFLHF